MEQKERDFVKGKVEKKEFENGGSILKVSIPMDELQRIAKNGWVNIDIKTGKESGKLYMENNTYQKDDRVNWQKKEDSQLNF